MEFRIGDTVKHKLQTGSDLKFFIMEKWTQECLGGKQVWYDCRPFSLQKDWSSKDRSWQPAYIGGERNLSNRERFREDELTLWVEV